MAFRKELEKILEKAESIDEFCHELMMAASDNGHAVPILTITIDLEKYNKEKNGSCDYCVIPDLQKDEHVRSTLFELVKYIRDNYDCNKFVEVE